MVLLTGRVFRQCVFDRNSIYNLLKRSVTLKSVALEKLYTTSALRQSSTATYTGLYHTVLYSRFHEYTKLQKRRKKEAEDIDVKETRNKR